EVASAAAHSAADPVHGIVQFRRDKQSPGLHAPSSSAGSISTSLGQLARHPALSPLSEGGQLLHHKEPQTICVAVWGNRLHGMLGTLTHILLPSPSPLGERPYLARFESPSFGVAGAAHTTRHPSTRPTPLNQLCRFVFVVPQ